MPIAMNPETGEALYLDNGAWKPAPMASHPDGRKIVFDGKEWQALDKGQAKPQTSSNEEIEAKIRQREMEGPSTTASNIAGAVTRGIAPVTAGAAAGFLAGGPAGAVVGAAAPLAGDLVIPPINAILGSNFKTPTEAVDALLTKIGVPQAKTDTEKVIQAISGAIGSTGSFIKGGEALMQSANPVLQRIGQVLASSPGTQAISAGAGAAAGQAVQNVGGGVGAQLAANIAASVAAPAMVQKTATLATGKPISAAPATLESQTDALRRQAVAESQAKVAQAAEQVSTTQTVPPKPVMQQETVTPEEVGDLIRKATSFSFGSTAAKEKLASMAKSNPEAKAAAERLKIELPFDVFSDNPQIREAAGLTRSLAGSEASANWQTTVRNAVSRADDIMKELDASYVEGVPSTGLASKNILENLKTTRSNLEQQAKSLYDEVDNSIPKTTNVTFPKLTQTLSDITAEVGDKGLTAQEKKLLDLSTDPKATYGRLLREKNLIGQAIAGKDSPYGNLEASSLKRLYGSLAEDQLANVESFGGEELRKKLRSANLLTAQKKALEKRIVGAFGTESDGSVANLMQSAIKASTKGDAAQFNKLMKVVPDNLKRETVATALASVATSSRAAQEGAFGFAEFAKSYKGLRANPEVYSQIVKILGKDADKTLRDLYEVSRRITDARAQVLTTGKANQALVSNMNAENLVGKIMQSSAAQRVATGAAAIVPGGGFFAQDIIGFMNAKKDTVKAAGELFNSPQFQNLVTESAKTEKPNPSLFKELAKSKSFNNFANKINIPKDFNVRVEWLQAALQSGLMANKQQNGDNQ